MTTKKIHFISGLILTVFVGLHLYNHTMSIFGADKHIEIMHALRLFYRNIFVEAVLLISVLVQIISGLKLFNTSRKTAATNFEKLHIWSGLYLAGFFIIHVSAILVGRFLLKLDTNFYFGVAGLNAFPFNLFFIPYYALAILSFFGHIASIHHKKMKHAIVGLSPNAQARALLVFGFVLTIVVFYGLTNQFRGLEIPEAYRVLIGE